jgi:hypothetical protein
MSDSIVVQKVSDLMNRLTDPMVGIPVVIAVAVRTALVRCYRVLEAHLLFIPVLPASLGRPTIRP